MTDTQTNTPGFAALPTAEPVALVELENQAKQANQIIAGAVPRIESPFDGVVDLVRGIHRNGVRHTRAEVRELTGEDEEAIAKFDFDKRSVPEFITLLLSRAVLRIGDVEVPQTPQVVNELTLGDRDILFLAVIRATYGQFKTLHAFPCENCGEGNDVTLDLDNDFPMREVDGDPLQERYSYTLRNGLVAEFRLPTGADQESVARRRTASSAERNTEMIGRCVLSVDGRPPVTPDAGIGWAKALGIMDRRHILNILTERSPGPSIGEVDAQCAACGEKFPIPMDWAALLYA